MRALISGSSGQDGYFLVRYLKSLGYTVIGGVRRSCEHLQQANVETVYMDLRDYQSVQVAIRKTDPHEIYNLGAQSFVPPSWDRPDETFDVNVGGLARILEFVESYNKGIKVYQASSSEMFGNAMGRSDENTPMNPTSPYGVAKLAAHHLCRVYRQKGLFISSGICFNHESERRGSEMVTRKITKAVARWACGSNEPLRLGSTDVYRDWGYAGDYVKAMVSMLQLSTPDDFVIATGEPHTVQEFLDEACRIAKVNPIVEFDSRFIRTGEIKTHVGHTAKAKKAFGFEPKVKFKELVRIMVEHDINEEALRTGKRIIMKEATGERVAII